FSLQAIKEARASLCFQLVASIFTHLNHDIEIIRSSSRSLIYYPSGEANSPRNEQFPSLSREAYAAIGVRQLPSRTDKNSLSHATANLVSSWFNEDKSLPLCHHCFCKLFQ
ncbi:Os02g0168850, partial [Oryza sativa Japonica Group]